MQVAVQEIPVAVMSAPRTEGYHTAAPCQPEGGRMVDRCTELPFPLGDIESHYIENPNSDVRAAGHRNRVEPVEGIVVPRFHAA